MAPPPGPRAVRPALAEGDLLAGRYRLVRPVPSDALADEPEDSPAARALLWFASDDVLARPVAVRVLPAGGRRAAAARRFLEAAAAAGTVESPYLARVYDAAVEERPAERAGRPAGSLDVAYVVREWVDGRPLSDLLLEDGPFDASDATALVLQACDGVDAAHAAGVVHGRLHPRNVLLTPSGQVRITDTALAAALRTRSDSRSSQAEEDVQDLGALLYAALTARWPATATAQPSGGLPASPSGPGLLRPRQVRAAVPRALDALVVRTLEPDRPAERPAEAAPRTPAALAAALERAERVDEPARPAPAARRPRVPPGVRRRLPLLVSLGLLLAVATGGWLLGLAIGTVDRDGTELEALADPVSAPSGAPGAAPVDLSTARVVDFDPPPGDGREQPTSVGNAVDGDASTAWETERYDSPAFGGLKPGVGLLVDLGAPRAVSAVEVGVAVGTTVELRAADAEGPDAAAYRVLARATAGEPVVRLEAATSARYLLVWLVELPAGRGGFRSSVSELRVLPG